MMSYAIILGIIGTLGLSALVIQSLTSYRKTDRAHKAFTHQMPPKPAGYVSPKGRQ